MNRKFFTSVIIREEGVRLDYYLTLPREGFGGYGVEVRQSPLDAFSGCAYLSKRVENITENRGEILTFLQELSNTATDPSCLEDIVAEL